MADFFWIGLASPGNPVYYLVHRSLGGIAQLGERLHGMQEVSGSIPLTSTIFLRSGRKASQLQSWGEIINRWLFDKKPCVARLCFWCILQSFGSARYRKACSRSRSSRGLGHHPFTVSTGVRIPYGTPLLQATASNSLPAVPNPTLVSSCPCWWLLRVTDAVGPWCCHRPLAQALARCLVNCRICASS